jgi:uroporphyrin-III C-methyltransferase/precorrin-2 dehydrogenase/sirohydrochlorin ferrochelatase
MASKNLEAVVQSLIEAGATPQKPLAVIEQATTPQQKIYISSLLKCITDFSAIQFQSPSLVIVGDVVNLHQEFHWFVAEANGSIFSELEK